VGFHAGTFCGAAGAPALSAAPRAPARVKKARAPRRVNGYRPGVNPYNPYQAPQTNQGDAGSGFGPNDSAQMAILEALKRTRPWVMFLSILGFLGAAGMVFFGLFFMVAGSAMNSLMKGPLNAIGPFVGFIYIVLGGLYVIPSMLLWRYASSISQFSISGGSMDALAGAVKAQASFWRYVGIMTAVIMGLYVVAIVIAVVVGIATAVSR
jgi:hypothetical protein